ncbi:MAG: GGDEF domain-containing protein, partial [Nitrospinae bacterium]|nr:GGDEF domain-containing protein [Nitrospinota bacterium]
EFQRFQEKTTFIMFDIDHFKKFNDNYGHQVGDKVLQTVARLVQNNIRKTDYLFRYGGEEFSVILTKTNIKDGTKLAEIMRAALANHVFKFKGERVSVNISLGVTPLKAGDTVASLIERGDKALYKAKENGRNRVEVLY